MFNLTLIGDLRSQIAFLLTLCSSAMWGLGPRLADLMLLSASCIDLCQRWSNGEALQSDKVNECHHVKFVFLVFRNQSCTFVCLLHIANLVTLTVLVITKPIQEGTFKNNASSNWGFETNFLCLDNETTTKIWFVWFSRCIDRRQEIRFNCCIGTFTTVKSHVDGQGTLSVNHTF